MRYLAVAWAAAAAWTLAGGAVPIVPGRAPVLPPGTLPAMAAAAAAAFATTLGLTANPWIGLAVAALAAGLPPGLASSRRRSRSERTADRWPDFLAAVRGNLAGGSTIPEAAIAAGHRVGDAFADLSDRIAAALAAGRSFGEAASDLRRAWADPLADRVLTTLAAAATTGGSRVSAILAALAASVSDELRLRRAHDAALTQQRLTAAVALVAPWVLLVLTTSTNPQASAALASPTGRLIVLGGLAATGFGYLLARRAARLGRIPRVFE